MKGLAKIVVLAPFGVNPPRSGGHSAVLEPARRLARAGADVHLFGLGVRRFEAFRHLRPFVREIEPRLTEERLVSAWNWLDYLRRGRSGLPPFDAAEHLAKRASPLLRERCEAADVLQYESPWLFDARLADRPRVLVAHNDETALIEALGRRSAAVRAAEIEGRAFREADLVLCFTDDDRDSLRGRHGKRDVEVVPLGVDTEAFRPASGEERAEARSVLGVREERVVLFTGAWHKPNRRALDRMRRWAEDSKGGVLFVVAGSVAARPERDGALVVTGALADLRPWFRAADCCVNPLEEGSGANVKLLEYLATGLPVITTAFGARGIELTDAEHAWIRSIEEFPVAVRELLADPETGHALGRAGRSLVCKNRSWGAIAARRRALIEALP